VLFRSAENRIEALSPPEAVRGILQVSAEPIGDGGSAR
jgi:hypothetical protein